MSDKVFSRSILGKKVDLGKLKKSNAFIRINNGIVTVNVYYSIPDVFKGQLRDVGFRLTGAVLPYNSNLASILKVEALGRAEGEVAEFLGHKVYEFVNTYIYKRGGLNNLARVRGVNG